MDVSSNVKYERQQRDCGQLRTDQCDVVIHIIPAILYLAAVRGGGGVEVFH